MSDEIEIRSQDAPPPDRAHGVVLVVAAMIMAICGVAFVVALTSDVLVSGDRVTAAGTALAVGFAAGAVVVRRLHASTYPYVEAAEPRHIAGEDADGEPVIEPVRGRRRLLTGTVVAGTGAVLASTLSPLASLGPAAGRPGSGTGWAAGVRLVDEEGRPLRAEDVPTGGLSVTWPEGGERLDVSAVVLIRLATDPRPPTRTEWVVEDRLIAYSKLCTHMGCPVGLLQEGEGSLFCPCHQARFDARRGAVPVFGPPPRPLPQLPLGTDDDGYLIATGDFAVEVGPTTGRSSGRPA